MSSIKDFTLQYVYLTNEGIYYRLQDRKTFTRESMRRRIQDVWGTAVEESKIESILTALEYSGTTRQQLRDSKKQDKDDEHAKASAAAYEAIKPHIRMLRYNDMAAPLLYAVSKAGEVQLVGGADEDSFRRAVAATPDLVVHMKAAFEQYGTGSADFISFLQKMYRQLEFDSDKSLAAPPPALSWDPAVPAFKVFNRSTLIKGPHPAWDQFLDRCSHPETIRAYIWSIFEPSNFGRQALWLQGEGGDGKSTVLRVLANFMGVQHTLTIGLGSYDSEFFYGSVYGKRLAIYPDCKNVSVLRKEKIKSMLGRDIAQINGKYEKPFSAQIYCKMLIGSNWLPQINWGDNSERSRLLVCTVRSYEDEFGDPDFEFKLAEQLPAFLLTCEADYKLQCPRGMNLVVPLAMQQMIKTQCAALDGIVLQEFIDSNLSFGPEYTVYKTTLARCLRNYFRDRGIQGDANFAFNDLGRLLAKRGVTALSTGGAVYKGVHVSNEILLENATDIKTNKEKI